MTEKGGDDRAASGAPKLTDDLDLENYDVRAIASDLTEIANLPKAVAATASRAALVPLVVAVVTWIVFAGRMGWPLFFFVIIAAILSLGFAAVLAVALFTRRQIDKVNDASDRVLGVVSQMHGDLATLRSSNAQLTVRATATTLSNDVVFPMLEEMAVNTASSLLPGPLEKVARSMIGVPLGVIEKSIAAGIDALPLGALDAAINLGDGEVDPDGDEGALVDRAVRELTDRYADIQSSLEGLVAKVMNRSLIPFVLTASATAIPLVLWWTFGWIAS